MKLHHNTNPKQTVLITGSTGGLGKALAVECARRGWNLILTDQPASNLENFARVLKITYHINILTFACDLSDPNGCSLLMAELQKNVANITMLINVAGIDFEGFFLHQSLRDLQTMVRLNVEGPLSLIHEVIKLRDMQTTFRVINVSSMAAFYPMPIKATYAASKRFLLDLSQALNFELKDDNVSVTALCPAGMPTNRQCVQSINAQGWIGYITTMNTGKVAFLTIEAALRGKPLLIPGIVNGFIHLVSYMVPTYLKMKFIAGRWKTARSKRVSLGELVQV